MIGTAYAQAAGAPASQGDTLMGLLPIILMFVILYFLMIRPQMKKAKEHKTMIEALAEGRRGRRRRHRRQDHQDRRQLRQPRSGRQRRDPGPEAGGATSSCPRAPSSSHPQRPSRMNKYPVWKYVLIVVALRGEHRSTRRPTSSARCRWCRSPARAPRVKVDAALQASLEAGASRARASRSPASRLRTGRRPSASPTPTPRSRRATSSRRRCRRATWWR